MVVGRVMYWPSWVRVMPRWARRHAVVVHEMCEAPRLYITLALSGPHACVHIYVAAAHMAMSMLKSSTVVNITNRNEKNHITSGEIDSLLTALPAHSKKSPPVNAASRSRTWLGSGVGLE